MDPETKKSKIHLPRASLDLFFLLRWVWYIFFPYLLVAFTSAIAKASSFYRRTFLDQIQCHVVPSCSSGFCFFTDRIASGMSRCSSSFIHFLCFWRIASQRETDALPVANIAIPPRRDILIITGPRLLCGNYCHANVLPLRPRLSLLNCPYLFCSMCRHFLLLACRYYVGFRPMTRSWRSRISIYVSRIKNATSSWSCSATGCVNCHRTTRPTAPRTTAPAPR